MPAPFNFPVTSLSEALHVLNPNTELDVLETGLYVNLDSIRSPAFARKILMQLDIVEGQYNGNGSSDAKILLTGHRGSGKSVELARIAEELNPFYLPITINIETELVRLSSITPEDLYGLLIIKFYECLAAHNIRFNLDASEELTNIWFQEHAKTITSANQMSLKASVEAGVGIQAWFIKLKSSLSASVTADTADTDTVRQLVKAKIQDILRRWNAELAEATLSLEQRGLHGVVFIVDGTEKIPYDVAKKLFVLDAPVLQQIGAPLILASPVLSIHDIDTGAKFFNQQLFPMAKLDTDEKVAKFSEIITKRVDEATFFEPGILDCITRKSGGSIRQLLELSREALLNRMGPLVDKAALEETLRDKGLALWRMLRTSHVERLRSFTGDVRGGDEEVQQLLFGLVLLAQNGSAIVNPLIQPYLEGSQNYLCA